MLTFAKASARQGERHATQQKSGLHSLLGATIHLQRSLCLLETATALDLLRTSSEFASVAGYSCRRGHLGPSNLSITINTGSPPW